MFTAEFINPGVGNPTINYTFTEAHGGRIHRLINITEFHHYNYLALLAFREELYNLKPKLCAFVDRIFGNTTRRWWEAINELNRNEFLENGDTTKVDPSNLLKLILRDPLFRIWNNVQERQLLFYVRNRAYQVYEYRNKYYGHVPELTTNLEIQSILRSIDLLSGVLEDYLQQVV